MKILLQTIKWDLLRQQRYQIFAAAALLTVIYIALLRFLPLEGQHAVIITMIYSDPTSLGLLFIGAIYLFEKSENTLAALAVTPMRPWHYLLSKTLTLSLLAVLCSIIMMLAAVGQDFHLVYFVLGIGLSASLFTLLGFTLASGCNSFNEYIMKMALIMLPVALPILDLFGVWPGPWNYVIPVQAGLVLLEASLSSIANWEIIYGTLYLLVANILAFLWAVKAFQKAVLK